MVKHCKVFAKLMPSQKEQVILTFKKQGEVVGMFGDRIDDCVALHDVDAGIPVDTRANAAKDCADVILAEKELARTHWQIHSRKHMSFVMHSTGLR